MTLSEQIAVLQWAESHAMIEFDEAETPDLGRAMSKLKEIIEKKYKIRKTKTGRYYTYYYHADDEGKKRIQLNKKTKEEIIEFLIYLEKDGLEPRPKTLEELFPSWIKMKEIESPTKNNAKRIRTDWKKYYEGDPIVKKNMEHITAQEWYEWKINKIRSMKLNKHAKNNMNSIANGIYDYAIRKGYMHHNMSREGGKGIPTSLTAVNEKRYTNNERVFMADEIRPALAWLDNHTWEEKDSAMYLGIGLNFFLGLRVGELCALQVEDFGEFTVYVHRQELVNFEEDGIHQNGVRVVEYTKKYKSREVTLSTEAAQWLRKIMRYREEYQITSPYLICNNENRRIAASEFERGMRKFCSAIGTTPKAIHGVRRSVISAVASRDLNLAQAMAGHASKQTTLDNYVYNQRRDESNRELLDSIYGSVYSTS